MAKWISSSLSHDARECSERTDMAPVAVPYHGVFCQ